MANFPKPSDLESQYLRVLKSIKPNLNVNDPNSDFVIRGKTFAGVLSGVYGDQAKIANDTFIRSARPEALDSHGADLGLSRNPATFSQSPAVAITGTDDGTIIPIGQRLRYNPTGIEYITISQGVISAGRAYVSVRAIQPGSIANVKAPDTLVLINPPQGIAPAATLSESLADGSDVESDDAYRKRLLSRYQEPPSGGNETDYINLAFRADPSIRSAFIRRAGRGLGTVDVYITSGTTDIDTSVTNGVPVVRIPSSIVLEKVQAYYNANVPLTDCPGIFAPEEVPVNVTVAVTLAPGLSLTSIPSDSAYNPMNLTVVELIRREVGRVLYNSPVGGRILGGGQGYIVSSDIEANLDTWLSARIVTTTQAPVGKIPVLIDRQVMPLDGVAVNRAINQNQIAVPGAVVVTLGV